MSVAVNKSGDDLETRLRQVAEISARFPISLEDAARSFQRFSLAGAASAIQFRKAGVNAWLGVQLGAQVSAEESRRLWDEAFNRIEADGTSATLRLSRSWVGILSMIEDSWFFFRARLARHGLFDAAKSAIDAVRRALDELRNDGTLDEWASRMSGVFETVLMGVGHVFVSLGNGVNAVKRNPLLAEFGIVGFAFLGVKGAALFAFIGDRVNALAEMIAGPQTELELRQERLRGLADSIARATAAARSGLGEMPARQLGIDQEGSIAAVLPKLVKRFDFEVGVLGEHFGVIWEDFQSDQTALVGDVFTDIGAAILEGTRAAFDAARAGISGDPPTPPRSPPGSGPQFVEIDPLQFGPQHGFRRFVRDQLKDAFDVALDPDMVDEQARLLNAHLGQVFDRTSRDMEKLAYAGFQTVGQALANGIIYGIRSMEDVLKAVVSSLLGTLVNIGVRAATGAIFGGPAGAVAGVASGIFGSAVRAPSPVSVGGLGGVGASGTPTFALEMPAGVDAHPFAPAMMDWFSDMNVRVKYAGG
jgi:hypothetical protein